MMYLSWKGRILFGMAVFAYGLLTYWLFWPYQPMNIHHLKIMNLDKVVYAGGDLLYENEYSKSKAYPVVSVSRQLINAYVILLAPSKGSSLPAGEHMKVKVRATIPGNASAGMYYLHLAATYQVNPIRKVTITSDSDIFEIKRGLSKSFKNRYDEF